MPKRINFTEAEREILLDLAEECLDIIENKHTDNLSTAQKNAEWNKLTEKYNVTASNKRSMEQLKNLWHNMKNRSKIDCAEERKHKLATGGGPPLPKLHPLPEKIRNMLPSQMEPLQNLHDDDAIILDCSLSDILSHKTSKVPRILLMTYSQEPPDPALSQVGEEKQTILPETTESKTKGESSIAEERASREHKAIMEIYELKKKLLLRKLELIEAEVEEKKIRL